MRRALPTLHRGLSRCADPTTRARALTTASRAAPARSRPATDKPQPPPSRRGSTHPDRRPRRGKTSRRRPPPPTPPQAICVPPAGLTSLELGALAGVDAYLIASRAASLEPSHGSVDAVLPPELLALVAEDMALHVTLELPSPLPAADVPANSPRRAPVVGVMGHVDHGKTTLLDALRSSNVAASEAGGITQRLGAFSVPLPGGASATFLDTPGHAAFADMRAAGAVAADIVVLAVGADDGVMPQTLEAARHCAAARVPVVVALTKCDAPGADPGRVREQLSRLAGLVPEQLGGDVLCVEVAAPKGEGLETLVEATLLQAELVELAANADAPGRMIVIESARDRGTGPQATVVVQGGQVRPGDHVVFQAHGVADASNLVAKVRSLAGEKGSVERAGPGDAVALIGMAEPPPPGALAVVAPEKDAKRMAAAFAARNQRAAATVELARSRLAAAADASTTVVTDEADEAVAELTDEEAEDAPPERKGTLNVLVKGEVRGSADAAALCVAGLGTPVFGVRVLASGVGDVGLADIARASATAKVRGSTDDSVIVAFGVRASDAVLRKASRAGVDVLRHMLIYKLEDEVRERLTKHEARWLTTERVNGRARVVRVFEEGSVAGCSVADGEIAAGAQVRVLRFGAGGERQVVHEGAVAGLKHFAKDVRVAAKGSECGMRLEGWDGFVAGDVVEAVEIVQGDGGAS